LKDAGYTNTAVLPITLSPQQYDLLPNDALARDLRQMGTKLYLSAVKEKEGAAILHWM